MSKAFVRSIKNVTNGYTSAQVKVRNATSNDAWGPNTNDLHDIARLTYENHELFEVMEMLDRRLNDKGKNWRHVMKALTVLDYLVHFGSENVVLWCKENLYVIKTLREFRYIDDNGREQGASIRQKATDLTSLVLNDERLREERMSRGGSRRRRSRRRMRDGDDDGDVYDGSGRSYDHSDGELYGRNGGGRPQGAPPGYVSDGPANPSDPDLRRALEESRLTAENDERRRRQMAGGSDADLRKAIQLSEEEERYRRQQMQNDAFAITNSNNNSQPDLIDTADTYQAYDNFMPDYNLHQQQQYMLQQQQQQNQQLFGGQPYMQSMPTGMLDGVYQQTGFNSTPSMSNLNNAYVQQQQQQQPPPQPQPLEPMKTGSNNPFAAKTSSAPSISASASQPSLSQLAYGQQTQSPQATASTQQRLRSSSTGGPQQRLARQPSGNFDAGHMNELNTLLANGDGIDTFGNVGELRIPAQHTKTGTFVNSAGMGRQMTSSNSTNPFLGQQYTGIATTSRIQPAYTGYGFGNAQPQGEAVHQQRSNNLIDL